MFNIWKFGSKNLPESHLYALPSMIFLGLEINDLLLNFGNYINKNQIVNFSEQDKQQANNLKFCGGQSNDKRMFNQIKQLTIIWKKI